MYARVDESLAREKSCTASADGPSCNATYYLGAPVREQCTLSGRIYDYGAHAHCPTTVNANPDQWDTALHFANESGDLPVPWGLSE